MMKATAIAPANIAFIKYWGKKDDALRIPSNPSISMNLSAAITTTTVEFLEGLKKDVITFLPENCTFFPRPREKGAHTMTENEAARISHFLDLIRKRANISLRAKVVTQNTFPKGTGIASSASGFAALALAASRAVGLVLSEKELTILARMGSGSACRSIPDGFVLWEAGPPAGGSLDTSYAYSLFSYTHWDLRDIVVIVTEEEKNISSTGGMADVETSPLWQKRQKEVSERIEEVKDALARKDIVLLGETIEEDCLSMHEVMQTQQPPLVYWTEETRQVIDLTRSMLTNGIPVYFTIDAGPNVHLICEAKDEGRVLDKLKDREVAKRLIINKPAAGTRIIKEHLF